MESKIFAGKLSQMEQEHEALRKRVELFEQADRQAVFQEIQKLKDECLENEVVLTRAVTESRSSSAIELADAELAYRRKVEQGLHRLLTNGRSAGETAEEVALYAEYAIDFATQSVKRVLLAALCAIDLQTGPERTN